MFAAVAALVVILLLPTPAGLPVAGHRMLAILAFAVIIWMTEAIDYAVSAIVIAALMAFLLGLAPNVANPKVLLGTSGALGLAFSGFANTALVLVAAALFLAAAMTATGLDKRIALSILSRVGTETRHVVIGTILVGFVIALMVPSTTARVACLVPITLGIIAAFGVNKRGAFASMLMITTVQTASIWNVGIKTAAAQNMVAIGFIEKTFGKTITWLDWLIAAGPFAILMCIALYFVMTRMMPPEVAQVPGGREGIRKSLAALGPDEGLRDEAAGAVADLDRLLGDRRRAAQVRHQHHHDHRGGADVHARLRHHDLEGGAAARFRGAPSSCSASASASAPRCCRPRRATWLADIVVAAVRPEERHRALHPRR